MQWDMDHVVIDYQTVLGTPGIIDMYPQKKSILVFFVSYFPSE